MAKKKEKKVNVSGKPKHSLDVNRSNAGVDVKGAGGGGRTAATVRRLKMYNDRPKRNRKGKIVKHDLQSKDLPSTRIEPDRRWFGNTRVVNQKELEFFREELQNRMSNNYNVIIKGRKLPLSLLNDHGKVFEFWKKNEMTRNSVANYSKIIRLLCERNLMEEAISTFEDMKKYDVVPSLTTYNAMIHCFARNKYFDKSSAILDLMLEAGVPPTPDTFNGIIQAYGSFGMYDEMSKCVKRMESTGCLPNEITYNILATKFAQGGLIEKMEGVHRVLISKRMKLQPLTLFLMLEAYADLGILDRMEKFYSRLLNSKDFIGEGLIRKLAVVFIKNYRYSQLEDLGNDISGKSGRTDIVWYILLLSSACFMSKKGVESIAREMKAAKVQLNVTYVNILTLFYFRIKDFRLLHFALYQGVKNNIKPDIVTLGVLLDACTIGYDGRYILEEWRKRGYLEAKVELKTDHLVLDAFGKGLFLRRCEELYLGLKSKDKEKRTWKYCDLLRLVFGT